VAVQESVLLLHNALTSFNVAIGCIECNPVSVLVINLQFGFCGLRRVNFAIPVDPIVITHKSSLPVKYTSCRAVSEPECMGFQDLRFFRRRNGQDPGDRMARAKDPYGNEWRVRPRRLSHKPGTCSYNLISCPLLLCCYSCCVSSVPFSDTESALTCLMGAMSTHDLFHRQHCLFVSM
jgi:hypothetical protein